MGRSLLEVIILILLLRHYSLRSGIANLGKLMLCQILLFIVYWLDSHIYDYVVSWQHMSLTPVYSNTFQIIYENIN